MGWIVLSCVAASDICYKMRRNKAGAVMIGLAAYFGGIELALNLIVLPFADAWSTLAALAG